MSKAETILVTGGAGFVGSHFAKLAAEAGRDVIIIDDLSAGPPPPLPKAISLIVGDIGERLFVTHLMRERHVGAVAHFAGKSQCAESMCDPALYFDVNLVRTLQLMLAVRDAEVHAFLFSSTATVYGCPETIPVAETARCEPVHAYGASKLGVERALEAWATAYGLCWSALRRGNAAGADPNGPLRESHQPETHLIPRALDAGLGTGPPLQVYGDDYDTPDGTCIRDYIHVIDLASAAMAALRELEAGRSLGPLNVGTGLGASVREVMEVASRVIGRPIPHEVTARRPGDPARLVVDPARATSCLGWRPMRSELTTIIEDALRARRRGTVAQPRSA